MIFGCVNDAERNLCVPKQTLTLQIDAELILKEINRLVENINTLRKGSVCVIKQTEIEELIGELQFASTKGGCQNDVVLVRLLSKAASAIDELHEINKWYKYCLGKAEHADALRVGSA